MKNTLTDLTRVLGLYPLLRDVKDWGYRSLRDSKAGIGYGLSRLLEDAPPEAWDYSEEFDREGLIEEIRFRLQRETSPNGHSTPGVSSPLNLRLLYVLCRLGRPQAAVETGVASGASSWTLLSALEKNGGGRLYSIDLPPQGWAGLRPGYRCRDSVELPPGRAPGWAVPQGLRSRWELTLGDTRTELGPLLERLGRVQLFYHDAEHTREAMLLEYRAVWPHLETGGYLTSDDVGWNTAFEDFVRETGTEGAARRCFSFGLIRKP